MATNPNINYKVQFCDGSSLYFTTLKMFISKCRIDADDYGMKFLLKAYEYMQTDPQEAKYYKDTCDWHLFEKDPIKDIEDADVMTAIEEYFTITESNKLQTNRNNLFDFLFHPEKATPDNITGQIVNEETLSAILTHFSITSTDNKIETQIKAYIRFAQLATGGKINMETEFDKEGKPVVEKGKIKTRERITGSSKSLLYLYKNALYLFKALRNKHAHSLLDLKGQNPRIYFQFVAFAYISLTCLCRIVWRNKTMSENLIKNGYTEPKDFKIPLQPLSIKILPHHNNLPITSFMYQLGHENPIFKEISHENFHNNNIEMVISVPKYQLFNIAINDFQVTEALELKYFHWNPVLEITPPNTTNLTEESVQNDSQASDSRKSQDRTTLNDNSDNDDERTTIKHKDLVSQIKEYILKTMDDESVGKKLLFHSNFTIYMNKEDFHDRKDGFSYTVQSVMEDIEEIIRKKKEEYPNYKHPSKYCLFEFTFLNSSITEYDIIKKDKIKYIPKGKIVIKSSLWPPKNNWQQEYEVGNEIRTEKGSTIKTMNRFDLNVDAIENVTSLGNQRYIYEWEDAQSESRAPQNNVQQTVKPVIFAKLKVNSGNFVDRGRLFEIYNMTSEMLYVSGKNDSVIRDFPIARIDSEEILNPHIIIKHEGDMFKIQTKGKTKLNGILLEKDKWYRLPNYTPILLNNRCQFEFIINKK